MSLPNDLFSPVGVVPIALAFEAHRPNAKAPRKTWFALWKDDGFVKMKARGRIDALGKWSNIRKTWINAYHTQKVQKGISIAKKVTGDDEWCAEAYLSTDYSQLTTSEIEKAIKGYAVFNLLHRVVVDEDGADDQD